MNRDIVLSKRIKRKVLHKAIGGTKWEHSNDFILAVWDKYVEGKMSADHLMDVFPGRTFKAIEDKVYRMRGRAEKQKGDPDQLSLPLSGVLT